MRKGIGRDEAAVMLALLVGAADGKPQPEEEAEILARLGPQLGRLGPKGQAETVRLLGELLGTIGLDRTLSSIRTALPVPTDRIDAVRVAVDVAFADGRLAPAEAQRVADIADALGLEEPELRAILAGRTGPTKGTSAGESQGKAR